MSKNRKLSVPGSIFKPAKTNRLYIKFKGKQYSTGLTDDKKGWQLAKARLEQMYVDYYNLKQTNEPITFKEAWSAYEKTLIQRSERTKINYSHAFTSVVTNQNNYISYDIIESDILKYISSTKHKKSSINIVLNRFQTFLNYCKSKKWIEEFNTKKYFYKLEKNVIKSYSKEECYKIIKNALKTREELGYLVFFMLETGARDVDALTLEWTQIDFKAKCIHWKNKVTKLKETRPVSDKTIKILKKLQVVNKRKVFSWNYTTACQLRRWLYKIIEISNIERNGRSFQEFRVTFRMKLHDRGTPENYIRYLLRHSAGDRIMEFHYTDYNVYNDKIRYFLNQNWCNNGGVLP